MPLPPSTRTQFLNRMSWVVAVDAETTSAAVYWVVSAGRVNPASGNTVTPPTRQKPSCCTGTPMSYPLGCVLLRRHFREDEMPGPARGRRRRAVRRRGGKRAFLEQNPALEGTR